MDLQFESKDSPICKNKCGCYVSDPNFQQQFPNKHILVPLKSSEYTLEIVNSIANVTLVQLYQNPTDKYLEL